MILFNCIIFLHYLLLGHLRPKKLPAMIKKNYHNFLTKCENFRHSVVMLLQGPIALRKQRLALFIQEHLKDESF